MGSFTFLHRSQFPASREKLFQWHTRSGAFERLNPPWDPVRIIKKEGGIQDGARISLQVPLAPFLPSFFSQTWEMEHFDYQEGHQFCDRMISGPFRKWEHIHRFLDAADGQSFLEEQIEIRLPGGSIGNLLGERFVKEKLQKVFSYRHEITAADMLFHQHLRPLRIGITGASGFVGSHLIPFLTAGGHTVLRLTRKPARAHDEIDWWNSSDLSALEGIDAVIHLAGENIASGRWTGEKKRRMYESRVEGTRKLCEKLLRLRHPPSVFVAVSAIGIYGDRGDEILDERSLPGDGFLASLGKDWEKASSPLTKAGIRVVHPRFGIILSPDGGALQKMLLPFSLGIGGKLGDGKQYFSWVALEDVLRILVNMVVEGFYQGPVNVTSPFPVTNQEFTRILGTVLKRPTFFSVPKTALQTIFGEMADEALLASERVLPKILTSHEFSFLHPTLKEFLQHSLKK